MLIQFLPGHLQILAPAKEQEDLDEKAIIATEAIYTLDFNKVDIFEFQGPIHIVNISSPVQISPLIWPFNKWTILLTS